jgi:hypothetical protein
MCGALFLLGIPGILLARPSSPTTRRTRTAPHTGSPDKANSTSWLGIIRTAPAILLGTAFLPLSTPSC